MEKRSIKKGKVLRWIQQGLYWAIPVIILYVIFRRIDFNLFWTIVKRSNPWFCTLGTVLCLSAVLIGGWRWQILLRGYEIGKPKLYWVLRHYYIGLTLGQFTPASLGWEGYRVVVSGKNFGKYSLNFTIILVEKIIATVTGALLIIMVYPMLSATIDIEFENVLNVMYILVALCLMFFVGARKLFGTHFVDRLLNRFEKNIAYARERLRTKLNMNNNGNISNLSLHEMMEPFMSPKKMVPLVLLTIAIRLATALGHHIFFYSLDIKMPFLTNLFVVLLLFFIFILPISFGGLGVREGAFIMLYKPFGVSTEIALIVSFFTLFAMIINYLIGALFIVVPSRYN